jgi:hypothetical protein
MELSSVYPTSSLVIFVTKHGPIHDSMSILLIAFVGIFVQIYGIYPSLVGNAGNSSAPATFLVTLWNHVKLGCSVPHIFSSLKSGHFQRYFQFGDY